MKVTSENSTETKPVLDNYTNELLDEICAPVQNPRSPADEIKSEINQLLVEAKQGELTNSIVMLFSRLLELRKMSICHENLDISREDLEKLALKHQQIDEHMVTVGGRVSQALPIANTANSRVEEYLQKKDKEASSGIELWDQVQENIARIKRTLKMSDDDWNSFSGQIRHAVDSVETLGKLIDLPADVLQKVANVTKSYRIRLTPYYTSLIMPGQLNDPIMLQSVPTGEMIENAGIEIPPVAADHSPARLVDQFYPRVVTIKATNMCAMYCTHCLRLAHIGRKDKVYSKEAYGEALHYIRNNKQVRDVLITGGDAFVLPNSLLEWLLGELDQIEHLKTKRLGTRIPVTAPMRVDNELLDILEASNDKKPVRVVTQINTPQEITPVSMDTFRQISKRTFTVLNQAVLLKGINDTRVKMWKLCETVQEAYVRPYYLFNCSYRNPQFKHFRVPIDVGQDLVESMYGNISGDAIPRYIATAGGKIPLHRSNVVKIENGDITLRKPWSGEEVTYPDADQAIYENESYAFKG
ncbi:KamA family radical SAM protein [Desulfosediminicola ganghwensis]|uniref:KamA family radical SAM protein n=1 Tax=Desulfosediminicola ganghwensis TaxID=2569540 RepID=UPI0010ACC413|nr:KamA family radical SAM protein [Desulfosediminicola ganghwensis]